MKKYLGILLVILLITDFAPAVSALPLKDNISNNTSFTVNKKEPLNKDNKNYGKKNDKTDKKTELS